ncbi:hypothetical protein ACVRW4_00785 [Streptococcus phocae subsp. phocae]
MIRKGIENMSLKTDILESWIMVEHISEGNININDKKIISFTELENDNYYKLLNNEIKKCGHCVKNNENKKKEKEGIVIYFDIFNFNEILDLFRKKHRLQKADQNIVVSNKFSFALYFDKNLQLISDKTFLSASYYIRHFEKIPRELDFHQFEEEFKKSVDELFRFPESDETDIITQFNEAMSKFLIRNDISIDKCYMKVLENLETDATNLHSFFINDLETAKKIETENLNHYILGASRNRIDLNSRKESSEFNPKVFDAILQPRNYPSGRYPSKTKYNLSLMQQVAVNLANGYDDQQMRSVNGPPGTGKTTLLRDIFAQLIVEQALDISVLPNKYLQGTHKTKYWDNASIGIMPDAIAKNGIVITSSNNGAIQNIVNELPLLSEIDKAFQTDIKEVDYFKEIINSKISSEWSKTSNGKTYEKLETRS